jgi:nucleoside-diphosphate-sugar epimerase
MTTQKKINTHQKEKILVTGAGGFVGSHLVEALLERGYDVTCLIRPGENRKWLKNLNVSIIERDITKKETIKSCLEEFSYIYHLAARMGGGDNPSYVYEVNYQGTKNIVESYLELGYHLKKFLFVSSVAAAGSTGNDDTNDEASPDKPESHYGKSKLKAEEFLYQMRDQMPYTTVRLPLVYGPRSKKGIFIFFKLVNSRIQLNVGRNFTVMGYVKDIVEGIILAAENPDAKGEKYYLGEDNAFSCIELNRGIKQCLGKRTFKIRIPYGFLYFLTFLLETVYDLFRVTPPIRRDSLSSYLNSNWRFSTRKARQELNHQINYPLIRGLQATADWYRENMYL